MSDTQKTVQNIKKTVSCSICLDIFTNPLTIPCGHTFCQKCIHENWDRITVLNESITCPDCRLEFPERPEPQKNVCLHNVVDDLKEMEKKGCLVTPKVIENGPKLPTTTICQNHSQEFIYFCCTEKRCICKKCLLEKCRKHDFEAIEVERAKKMEQLSKDFQAKGLQKEHIEKEIAAWTCKRESIKDFHGKLVSSVKNNFDKVRKTLKECETLSIESIRCEEEAALTKVSDHLQFLQQHLQDLNQFYADAEQLLDPKTGDVGFLERLPLLSPIGSAPVPPKIQLCEPVQMTAVAKILPEVTRILQEELPNALHHGVAQSSTKVPSSCHPTQTSIPVPGIQRTKINKDVTAMSSIRTQLIKDYRNLLFDSNTANKYIEISHQNHKATHKTSPRRDDVPVSHKRFESWQVMCTEGFSKGSHYWEVETSIPFVQIGVAYSSLKNTEGQENKIGRNSCSWSLELRSMGQSVWHRDKEIPLTTEMYRRIGVHLDFAANSITFYGIKEGGLEQLHMFQSVFSEELYPVFWIGEDVTVKLIHIQYKPGNGM